MHKHIRIAALALVIALPTLASAAEQERAQINVAQLGPQVGEQVPDFNLPDQSGQVHTLHSIMGPNGAMVLFHRSADW